MEPICEAKFSNSSYGFRPNCSVEHAIQRTYNLMQLTKLHYVIEFDIKGFFDNVNHSKLIKQIWALGIQDKHLLYVLRQILKAPIRMPDGSMVYPQKEHLKGVSVRHYLQILFSMNLTTGLIVNGRKILWPINIQPKRTVMEV